MYVFFCAFSLPSFQSNWLSPAIGQINHPGGPFYWLISQLSFHDHPLSMPSLFSLLSHTFKIFIIKHIRVCFFFFFCGGAYFKALPGCVLFPHSNRGTGSPQSPSSTRQTLVLCFMLQCCDHYTEPVSLAAL